MSASAENVRSAAVARGAQCPTGRGERVRIAVAEAVRDLVLEQGPEFPIGQVAERAGVDRSTVYRRWPQRADLIGEALTLYTRRLEVPEHPDWRCYVEELAQALCEFSKDPFELCLNAMIFSRPCSEANAELSRCVLASSEPVIRALEAPLERAIARGELRADARAETLLEMIWAPIVVRSLAAPETLSPEYAREIADHVIRAASAPTAALPERSKGSESR